MPSNKPKENDNYPPTLKKKKKTTNVGEEIVLSPNFVGGCKNIYIHSWDNVVTHEYHPPTFLSFFFYFPIPKTSPLRLAAGCFIFILLSMSSSLRKLK